MFKSIDEYYQFIEEDTSLSCDHTLSQKVRSLFDKIEDVKFKKECSYELYFINFKIDKGVVKPSMSGKNEQGHTVEYPSFDLFEDNLDYIKQRSEIVINPKYKSKYNHLLWRSDQKHINYAKQAIDSYFILLTNATFPLIENRLCHAFKQYFENLFLLSQSINYKIEELKSFLLSIIETDKINGFQKCSLMKFIIEYIKKQDILLLDKFYDYSNKVIDSNLYPDFVSEYLDLLIILCQKKNISTDPYHNKLGDFHILQAIKHKENFVSHDFYLKALVQYKKANNSAKVEETSSLIDKAKANLNFKSIKLNEDDIDEDIRTLFKKCFDAMDQFTDQMIENNSIDEIFNFLIHSDKLFPKADVLTNNIQPAMLEVVTVRTFDINGNISNSGKPINSYYIHVTNFSLPYLWMIFRKGINNDKISYESLIEYLQNNSWYARTSIAKKDGEIEQFNWIELLSPSLLNFFDQIKIDISLNKEHPYILPIDSLVIKFEGLLREFSRKIGAQAIEVKTDGTEERISFEKLFDNPKLKNLVPADDIALFRFLFTSEGMNLRNNVAHCFYKTSSYSSGVMLLLITALLKLGKYEFTEVENI